MQNSKDNPPIVYGKLFEDNLIDIRTYLSDYMGIRNTDEKSLGLIAQAFTTPGYANEHRGCRNYQRLEFLGDAIIKFHLSKTIFERYPKMDEGRMSKICQNLWNDKTYPYALLNSGMNFHYLVLMPKSEENQDRGHKTDFIASMVSDCFEALIGALELTCLPEVYEGVIDRVLLRDVDTLVQEVSKLDIREWDNYLNKIANKRIA